MQMHSLYFHPKDTNNAFIYRMQLMVILTFYVNEKVNLRKAYTQLNRRTVPEQN